MNRTLSLLGLFGLLSLATFSEESLDDGDHLARWEGGRLSRAHFVREYDPDETLLKEGGRALAKAVYKACYLEIFGAKAIDAGIDREPEFLANLDDWSRNHLAEQFLERNRPNLEPTDTELRALFESLLKERFTSAGSADIDVLFIRCNSEMRNGCLQRLEGYRTRNLDGEDFNRLVGEEREISGEANGSFEKVALDRLSAPLRAAIQETPAGQMTDFVSTPQGFFWVRVSSIKKPSALTFEQARKVVRKELLEEKEAEWRQRELQRIRSEMEAEGIPLFNEADVLAAAAQRDRMHLEAKFLAAKRERKRWALADAAFYRDPENLPSEEAIREKLQNPKVRIQHEERSFLIAIVSAAEAADQLHTRAQDLIRLLQEGRSPARILTREAALDETMKLLTLKGVTLGQWSKIHPALGEEAFSQAVGSWSGSFAFRESFIIEGEYLDQVDDRQLPAGLAFVVVLDSTLPPMEALREKFLRDSRHEMGSMSRFEEASRRWNLELLVDYEP